ncbi:ATP-binding protein [Streptomyces sp. NPDC048512]|uniref:ATP-binding protein n=1 Tax=unclassified Streptomyces TaxID=2593676 RepID=UPI0009C0A8ED|nr:ATP-binding protein [Streptomyces sp. M41(2017)]OQQ13807.1 ATP-binding protein [Streptomyces sp. M41(2017)]
MGNAAREGAGTQGDSEPVEATVTLPDEGQSIAEARHLAAAFLSRVRTDHLLDISRQTVELTQLVVSELVTNARKYAPGPILLRLRILAAMLEISVWDSAPNFPVAKTADPGRIGQHGLEIVMAIAQKVDVQREPVGKRVTAHLALDDSLAGRAIG